MKRQQAERRGRGAETLACWYLRLLGWHILARRARVAGGEVDIVARRRRTLAFIEVKARASEDAAAMSLDKYRLRLVATAAKAPRTKIPPPGRRHADRRTVHRAWPLAPSPHQCLARVTKPRRLL